MVMRTTLISILGALAMVFMIGCESTIVEEGPRDLPGRAARTGTQMCSL
jgi:hypothetical protein